jgi:hypothetical protein
VIVTEQENQMATSIFRDNATIASRYLADQLTDAERMAYEAALVEDPEILRELEATARMKVGLARLRSTGELQGLLRQSRLFQPQVLIAMAATVAAIVIGIGLWRTSVNVGPPQLLAATLGALKSETGQALPLGATEAAFRRRADDYDALLQLPSGRVAVELRVLPQVPVPSGRYRLALSRTGDDESSRPIASISGLSTAPDGFIEVFLDASKIAPGRYRVVIADDRAPAETTAGDALVIKVISATTR